MCWGDDEKKEVQQQTSEIAEAEEARRAKGFGAAYPFYQQRMKFGLPYKNQFLDYRGGELARQAAPRRAAILRRAAMSGMNRNDPALLQTMTDFEAKLARAHEGRVSDVLGQDEATRQAAARALFGFGEASDPLRALALLKDLALA